MPLISERHGGDYTFVFDLNQDAEVFNGSLLRPHNYIHAQSQFLDENHQSWRQAFLCLSHPLLEERFHDIPVQTLSTRDAANHKFARLVGQ